MKNREVLSSFHPSDLPEHFWSVIASARQDRNQLAQLLSRMSREEIIEFGLNFREAAVQLTDEPYTAYMEAESEDDIQDVADWVVSQGKEFYSLVWTHPEELSNHPKSNSLSTFTSVAENILWKNFRESMPSG